MLTRNHKLTKKTSIALLSLLFLCGLSIAGLGREELLHKLHLLPAAQAQETTATQTEAVNTPDAQAASESHQADFASLRSLKGRYLDAATATVLPGGFAPAACVGIVTFDGRGKLKATETHSFNGFIVPEAHYTGTYTINDDYSGIMTLKSVEQGFEFKQKFVLNPVTNEITYIVIEDGEVSTGTMKKMQ